MRNEIDNLKREAFEDLKYINDILTSEPLHKPAGDLLMMDVDQVYLRNDEMNDVTPTGSPKSIAKSGVVLPLNVQTIDNGHKHKRANVALGEEDDEEDTQYMSQPASCSVNDNSSCQIYMTPAGSWQTLTNLNVNVRMNANEEENSLTPQQLTPLAGITPIRVVDTDDNKTDLDEQEFDEERGFHDNNYNESDEDETENTLRNGVSEHKDDLIYTKTTTMVCVKINSTNKSFLKYLEKK